MDSYKIFCEEIDKASNITELRCVIKYSAFKHNKHLISLPNKIVGTYEGKNKRIGRRFTELEGRIKNTLKNYIIESKNK